MDGWWGDDDNHTRWSIEHSRGWCDSGQESLPPSPALELRQERQQHSSSPTLASPDPKLPEPASAASPQPRSEPGSPTAPVELLSGSGIDGCGGYIEAFNNRRMRAVIAMAAGSDVRRSRRVMQVQRSRSHEIKQRQYAADAVRSRSLEWRGVQLERHRHQLHKGLLGSRSVELRAINPEAAALLAISPISQLRRRRSHPGYPRIDDTGWQGDTPPRKTSGAALLQAGENRRHRGSRVNTLPDTVWEQALWEEDVEDEDEQEQQSDEITEIQNLDQRNSASTFAEQVEHGDMVTAMSLMQSSSAEGRERAGSSLGSLGNDDDEEDENLLISSSCPW